MFLSLCSGPSINNMAARLFNAIGKVGIGLAVAGGVVQSALYNGETLMFYSRKRFICLLGKMHSCFCLCGSILLTPKDTAECHVWLSVCLRLLSPIATIVCLVIGRLAPKTIGPWTIGPLPHGRLVPMDDWPP